MSGPSTGAPLRCTVCGSPLENPIGCFDCHTIFPTGSAIHHFQRLGLPTTYRLDLGELERAYLSWSRELHPDFFQLRPEADRQLSLSLSASLNDAYRTLKDPIRRAEYLLQLRGGPTASQERSMPEGFLEDVLELRMEIEEIKQAGEERTADRRKLEERLHQERASAMEEVAALFGALESSEESGAPEKLLEIRRRLNTVKYLDGLLRDLNH